MGKRRPFVSRVIACKIGDALSFDRKTRRQCESDSVTGILLSSSLSIVEVSRGIECRSVMYPVLRSRSQLPRGSAQPLCPQHRRRSHRYHPRLLMSDRSITSCKQSAQVRTLSSPQTFQLVLTLIPRLPASTPHTLQEPIPLRKTVDTVVALAHGAHEAAQRVHLVLARVTSIGVDLADRDLHGAVVLGLDDAVRCAALAGDVAVKTPGVSVLLEAEIWVRWERSYRSTSSPRSFSMVAELCGLSEDWLFVWVWRAWKCVVFLRSW